MDDSYDEDDDYSYNKFMNKNQRMLNRYKNQNQIMLNRNSLMNFMYQFDQFFHIFNRMKNKNFQEIKSKQFKPCHFELRDKGAFWCKEGYVRAFDSYGKCKTIAICDGETSFNCYSYINGDECDGGIEVGYDIRWGTSWPIRHRFIDGDYFKGKKINLSSLFVQISGTVRNPKVLVIDGNDNQWSWSP